MQRDTRKLVVAASLALGTVALVWWLMQPKVAVSPISSAERRAGEQPTRLSDLTRVLSASLTRTTRLRIRVMDAQEKPLQGVHLSMVSGQSGITDGLGELVLDGVPLSNDSNGPTVEGPWLVLEGSSRGFIEGIEQTRLLFLEPACPGVVRVVDTDGTPVVGAILNSVNWTRYARPVHEQEVERTDHQGEVSLPLRPCGAVTFSIGHQPAGSLPWLSAEVVGDEPVTLVLPAIFEGVVAVVDAEDRPLDAEIESSASYQAERLGRGLFLLRSRRTWATVVAQVDGYPTHQARVPLDGGEHMLALHAGRQVEVTVLCDDDCPEELSCSHNVCEPLEEDRLLCTCPQGESYLSGRYNSLLGTIPADVARYTLEMRADAIVRGRWTGGLPCYAWGQETRYGESACRPDGRFEVEGLRPGPNTISVRHGLNQEGSVYLDLEAGVTVDVGEIGPSDWTVDGVIDADFSLDGAMLSCSPMARVELEPDGGFLLHSLPAEADSIELLLWAPIYGGYRERFSVPASGSLPTWMVSQAEIADTTPLDDDYQPKGADTGDTGDPSAVEQDSGWQPWHHLSLGDTGHTGWEP